DSYHSLSIEGYRVTDGLIERVRTGQWDPQEMKKDSESRNALAARGYYQAFQTVRSNVREILQAKETAGAVVAEHLQDWHFELFEPCVQAAIIQASDLVGYRKNQVYISGSKHTPLHSDAVVDAMQTFYALLKQEENSLVRAVLGHFFFVYIHPYMDGNGRTARFIMNAMLITGGYSWTIIPVEKRDEYMSALEKASVDGDIVPFAKFIYGLIR
ncbi:MAG TPA: Fic family protein, partial [Paludibacteraceae bacterium]|nr:Fic family protein [Paludibacteraceae bacterium]